MSVKTGKLIKEARTSAGLTQEQLAKKVTGATASDIGKAERGEKDLTQAQLKEIAKATGVTQSSLINSTKKTSGSSTKKTNTSANKTGSSKSAMKLTAAEEKLIKLYRDADKATREKVVNILKGEDGVSNIMGMLQGVAADILKDLK